jgi:hypothetical protein
MKTLLIPPREINDQTLRIFFRDLCEVINQRFGNIPDDSTASDVPGVVIDLNALQDILR